MARDDHAYIVAMYAIGDVIFMHQRARGPVPCVQTWGGEETRLGQGTPAGIDTICAIKSIKSC